MTTRKREGRETRSEYTILSATSPPPGWSCVYVDETLNEDETELIGVRLYTVPVYALVLVREREYYADNGAAVDGAIFERVEMLDTESQHDGFWPWELNDWMGYAPPGYRFKERDTFWWRARWYLDARLRRDQEWRAEYDRKRAGKRGG